MPLRLVRCPFCRQRFNIGSTPSGSRIQCAFCAAILTVPAPRTAPAPRRRLIPEKPVAQIALAAAMALLLAGFAYLALRPERPVEPKIVEVPSSNEAPAPSGEDARLGGTLDPGDSRWIDKLPAEKQRLFQEFAAPRHATMAAYPWLVLVEDGPRIVKTDIIDDYTTRLRMLHRVFLKEFDELPLPVVTEVLPVIILNSRASYDRYCEIRHKRRMPREIPGMYEYSRKRTVMYHDLWAPYEVILHEGTHQLMHHYSLKKGDAVNAYWFQEGVATYFEGFRRELGEVVWDPHRSPTRLPAVRKALQDGSLVPVRRLVSMSIDDFWKWFGSARAADGAEAAKLAQLYYAESWALVYFMLHGEEGRYRKAFFDYFRYELEGDGTIGNFEKSLHKSAGTDLSHFHSAFVDYLRELK